MKKNLMLLAGMALTMGLVNAAIAAPGDSLIYNGSFESGVAAPSGGYSTVFGPSYGISYWRVDNGSVDVINGAYGAISGNSIDLLGTPGPGTLSQSFYASELRTYELKFDLFRNRESGQALVVFGDQTQTFTSIGNTATTYSMLFRPAAVGGYSLSFTGVSVGGELYSGAVIDNVSVLSAVPEPETYAMLLAGLGIVAVAARRRQAANSSAV